MKHLIIVFAALSMMSCTDFLDQSHFEVDTNLQYYTDKFFNEASVRGLNIKPNSLIVKLGDCQKQDGVLGITKYHSITTIIIDRDFFEYNKMMDSLMIETVVFHELGHAVLHRDHCDDYSLMNPNKYVSDYRLNDAKRKTLTDELLKY